MVRAYFSLAGVPADPGNVTRLGVRATPVTEPICLLSQPRLCRGGVAGGRSVGKWAGGWPISWEKTGLVHLVKLGGTSYDTGFVNSLFFRLVGLHFWDGTFRGR